MMIVHDSDCAINNAPALPVGSCNCGADKYGGGKKSADIIKFVPKIDSSLIAPYLICGDPHGPSEKS